MMREPEEPKEPEKPKKSDPGLLTPLIPPTATIEAKRAASSASTIVTSMLTISLAVGAMLA